MSKEDEMRTTIAETINEWVGRNYGAFDSNDEIRVNGHELLALEELIVQALKGGSVEGR